MTIQYLLSAALFEMAVFQTGYTTDERGVSGKKILLNQEHGAVALIFDSVRVFGHFVNAVSIISVVSSTLSTAV